MTNPSVPQRRAPALRNRDGWKIGQVGTTPILLARSWIIIGLIAVAVFAPIAARSLPDSNTAVVVAALGFVVVLLTAVLAHELGHTFMARAAGHRVHRVVITAWGGHTSFSTANARPMPSLLIALVGPAVNLLLAGLFRLGFDSVNSALTDDRGVLLALILNAGVVVNGLMGVFNLLPVLPLDGARALEALLWRITGDRDRATVIVAWTGRVLVLAVAVFLLFGTVTRQTGPVVNLPVALILCWFGWRGSSAGLRQVRQQRRIRELSLTPLMRPVLLLDQNSTVAVVEAEMRRAHKSLVVLTNYENQARAYIEQDVVAQVPRPQQTVTPALGVAVPLTTHDPLHWDLHGGELLEEIRTRSQHTPVVVVVDSGRIVGLLWVRDVVKALK